MAVKSYVKGVFSGLLIIVCAIFYEYFRSGKIANVWTFDGPWVKTKIFVVLGLLLMLCSLIGLLYQLLGPRARRAQ